MRTHTLKTWPQYFERVSDGQKTFEVRKNDRDFQVGDTVILELYEPAIDSSLPKSATPDQICFTIGYILHGGQFGIEPGYCVIQLANLTFTK